MKIDYMLCLGLIFIALKLAGVISWSWWIVLAPIYGPWVLVAAIVLLLMAFGKI